MFGVKKWFQSKTVWLGLLTMILSLLTFLQGESWIQQYPNIVSGIGTAIGALTVILRFVTTKPIVEPK